jgi:ABC-2 type transport system permease protein
MSGGRLLWLFVRLGIMHEFAYAANLVAQGVSSVLGLAASLFFLGAVFAHTDTLVGWRAPELLAVLAAFYLLSGLLGTIVQPSLQAFVNDVVHGTLDFTLTRPRDAQVLVSIGRVDVWRLVDVFLGMGLLIVAVVQLDGGFGPVQAAEFVVVLVAGGVTMYSCCLLLATLAFWLVRMDNELIVFLSFWEAARWPVDIYPSWLRGLLTFLVPLAFATTVPAQTLSSHLQPMMFITAFGMAGGLLAAAR